MVDALLPYRDRKATHIHVEYLIADQKYQIKFVDQYGLAMREIRLTKAELEMLDVQKELNKANETDGG